METSFLSVSAFRGLLNGLGVGDDEVADGVDLAREAGRDDGRGVELRDDRGAFDDVAGDAARCARRSAVVTFLSSPSIAEPGVGAELERARGRRRRPLDVGASRPGMSPTARTRTFAIWTSASSKRREYSRSWMSWNVGLHRVDPGRVDRRRRRRRCAARSPGPRSAPRRCARARCCSAVDAVVLELRERLGLELRELLLERRAARPVGVRAPRPSRTTSRRTRRPCRSSSRPSAAVMPGIARHEHVLDADLGRDLGREERPAAALGDEHELARVEALAHRVPARSRRPSSGTRMR